jgi:hypothetical protein
MSGYRAGEDLPRIPVCHFELHLANAMAAGGMMFERHGSDQTDCDPTGLLPNH